MIYPHAINFITSIYNIEIAKAVSRAFDSDIGGAEAFQMLLSADGSLPATHAAYRTPCSDEFIGFLQLPVVQIKALVDANYAKRWAEFTSPSLDKITLFMGGLVTAIDTDLMQAIADNNLQIVQQNNEI